MHTWVKRSPTYDLIEVFEGGEHGIVACAYAGTLGAPVLFARRYFGELTALSGDRGAKPILEARRAEVARVPFPEGATDLNTPEDYQQFLDADSRDAGRPPDPR